MNTLKATIKAILAIAFSLLLIPLQLLVLFATKSAPAYILPRIWHKGLCLIFGIKITHTGKPHTQSQTIYAFNHLSYLDIIVIGSTLRASFVSKDDVASWPAFGFLSTLQQTAFISRSREKARDAKNTLDTMLRENKSLIIFPEGTSTDGRDVHPFKSSIFSIAYNDNVSNIKIQPVTLIMQRIDGHEIKNQEDRDLYAWHIDMTTPLGEHLWRFLKSRGAQIHLHYHPPINVKDFSNRKTLAKICHEAVSKGLQDYNNKQT
ncbi:MAG: lysophospholipid acyltransferase family protein [Alphaproteobacteria bacterium]